MKKILKGFAAIAGIGAIATTTAGLTSCKEIDHQDGFAGVNFRFSKDFVWAPHVSTHGAAGTVLGTCEVELYGNNLNANSLQYLNVDFISESVLFTKFVATITPINSLGTKGIITIKVGATALNAGDKGVKSMLFNSSNSSELFMNNREFSIWVNGN